MRAHGRGRTAADLAKKAKHIDAAALLCGGGGSDSVRALGGGGGLSTAAAAATELGEEADPMLAELQKLEAELRVAPVAAGGAGEGVSSDGSDDDEKI